MKGTALIFLVLPYIFFESILFLKPEMRLISATAIAFLLPRMKTSSISLIKKRRMCPIYKRIKVSFGNVNLTYLLFPCFEWDLTINPYVNKSNSIEDRFLGLCPRGENKLLVRDSLCCKVVYWDFDVLSIKRYLYWSQVLFRSFTHFFIHLKLQLPSAQLLYWIAKARTHSFRSSS